MTELGLSEVVGIFLDEINGGEAEYARAYRMAMRGMRELDWDVTGKVITLPLPVECDKTVCIPDDCVSIVGVGIANAKGEFTTLSENKALSMYEGNPKSLNGAPTNLSMLPNIISSTGSLGVGSYASYGEYKIDKSQNLIILSPSFNSDQILLKYLVRRKTDEDDYLIPEMASEALVAYLKWKWVDGKSSVPAGEKARLRSQWVMEKNKCKSRLRNIKAQDLQQAARKASRMGLKW